MFFEMIFTLSFLDDVLKVPNGSTHRRKLNTKEGGRSICRTSGEVVGYAVGHTG